MFYVHNNTGVLGGLATADRQKVSACCVFAAIWIMSQLFLRHVVIPIVGFETLLQQVKLVMVDL